MKKFTLYLILITTVVCLLQGAPFKIIYSRNCELIKPLSKYSDSTKTIGGKTLKNYVLEGEETIRTKANGFALLKDTSNKFIQIVSKSEITFKEFGPQPIVENLIGALFFNNPDSSVAIKLNINNQFTLTVVSQGKVMVSNYQDYQISSVEEEVSIRTHGLEKKISDGKTFLIHKNKTDNMERDFLRKKLSSFKKNAEYLKKKSEEGSLDKKDFEIDLPSMRNQLSPLETSFKGTFGTANYRGTQYHLVGGLGYFSLYDLELALDLYFSFQKDLSFRSEGWDQLQDLTNKILYLRYNEPYDNLFIKGGVLKDITYGQGLLVSRYNNTVISPFERKAGLRGHIKLSDFRADYFINSLRFSRVMGFHLGLKESESLGYGLTFVGDFDSYIDVDDQDGDTYPDKVDPQKNKVNSKSDSVIISDEPFSLRQVNDRQVMALGLDLFYKVYDVDYSNLKVRGELGKIIEGGMGLSFPNFSLSIKYVDLSIGFDLQSPHFKSSFFNRLYEKDKVSWETEVADEDTNTYLVTKESRLQDVDNYLVGWNNSIRVNLPSILRFRSKYKKLQQGKQIDQSFYSRLSAITKDIPYLTDLSLFMEKDHVQTLFGLRKPATTWGIDFSFRPHKTINVITKYKEINQDKDNNGEISLGEINREFSLRAAVDFQYYFSKAKKWWLKSSETKAEENL